MTDYRLRHVEAVQWSGSNWHEMLAFAGKDWVTTDGVSLFLKGHQVPKGDYVVKVSDDHFVRNDESRFEEVYEPVEAPV